MEAGGLIAEGCWTEFGFPLQGEESDIMEHLLGSFPSNDLGGYQELPWSDQASSSYYCDSTGNSLASQSAYEGYYLSNSNEALAIRSCVVPDDLSLVHDQSAADFLNMFSNHSLPVYGNGILNQEDLEDSSMTSVLNSACTTNKRKQLPEELGGQTRGRKRARKAESKGRMKKAKQSGDEDADIPVTSGSPTSCCTSDSDSNASQDCADVDAHPKAKARAGRGAATEPQSIYARKRRERINERLRILQSLVPNGTKVDISTMLEEAVHYVKFLQLQIKMLSSDDTWMYAPIAYNGMNIGLDLNMVR